MTDPVNKVLQPFLAEADRALVGSYSAVLYGSAARGHFLKGHSDINVMLVLERVTPDSLRALGRAFAVWRKARQPPPLIMSRAEWRRSADAFPIEISDMKGAYKVLRGTDPLTSVSVDLEDLRRALEREFRGKLMRLRQGFASWADYGGDLGNLARHSVGSVLLLLRSLLILQGKTAPNDPLAQVSAAAQLVGYDPLGLAEVVEQRGRRSWRCSTDTFLGYLSAVEASARFVDELKLGER